MIKMEALSSEDKKRALPTWMIAPAPEERRLLVKTPKRRRMAAVPAAAAGLPAVKTVYCMNEAELVDVALGVLIESRKQEKALEQLPLGGSDKPDLSPICSESPSSPGSSSEDEDNGESAIPPGGPARGPPDSGPACDRSLVEEGDVFQYVREIFFS